MSGKYYQSRDSDLLDIQNSGKFKIDLNAKDQYGYTAFLLACKNGHMEITEMLIKKSNNIRIGE